MTTEPTEQKWEPWVNPENNVTYFKCPRCKEICIVNFCGGCHRRDNPPPATTLTFTSGETPSVQPSDRTDERGSGEGGNSSHWFRETRQARRLYSKRLPPEVPHDYPAGEKV